MPEVSIEVIIVLVFVSTLLIVDGVMRVFVSKKTYSKNINKRLKVLEKKDVHQEALLELRHRRGLNSEGEFVLPVYSLNQLYLQSGISIGPRKFLFVIAALVISGFSITYALEKSLVLAGLVSAITGVLIPVMVARILRQRRQAKIEQQLPEALDVMRRSLHAGHPLSVAISMVAREMPDPIGSEFGITSDEMTYGMDLETAMENMGARIGQPDMAMVVVSVSIQSKTGGNLAELLSNLSALVRERHSLRRKVRALSAEGRFSALALSIMPIFLFGILLVIAPSFYGDVWGHPLLKPVLGFAVVLMIIGDIIMYRMVNFKF